MTDHPDHDPTDGSDLPSEPPPAPPVDLDAELHAELEAGPSGARSGGIADLPESGPGALAPIWARGIARVIDLFIIGVGGMFMANVFGAIKVDDDTVVIENQLAYALAILLVWAVYEVAGTLGGGRTVGKFALGLRIRRVTEDRAPAPLKALTRWLVMGVAMLLPLGGLEVVVLLVVYLTAVGNPSRQGIHDRAASTLVVRAR